VHRNAKTKPRGEEWSYLRGGLTCLDRDYGIFHKVTHDIGTHVVHHLFPQIPHYNLQDATAAVKPILGCARGAGWRVDWRGPPSRGGAARVVCVAHAVSSGHHIPGRPRSARPLPLHRLLNPKP
jgi:hypothetical protein